MHSLREDLSKSRAWRNYASTKAGPKPQAKIAKTGIFGDCPKSEVSGPRVKVLKPGYVGRREMNATSSGDLETRILLDLPAEVQRRRDARILETPEPDPLDAFLPKVDPRKAGKILAAEPMDHHPALNGTSEWRKPGTRHVPYSKPSINMWSPR